MKEVFLVLGLGFGDEGKGTITDYLVRQHSARLVVRFNGGPQAGHNVVTPEGTWHCFAQFGAGLFRAGTRAFCSEHMLVELEALRNEGEVLGQKGVTDAFSRLTLTPYTALITPFQKMLCQMQEIARGERRKGTCGMGVGQTVDLQKKGLAVIIRDVESPPELRSRLKELKRHAERAAALLLESCPSPEMKEIHAYFAERGDVEQLAAVYTGILESSGIRVEPSEKVLKRALDGEGTLLFEGAQGALLDQFFGFQPYTTPSRTTCHQALDLLRRNSPLHIRKIGVLRPFSHRHGPGPLVTEGVAGPLCAACKDPNNRTNRWQGPFRVGWLDLPAIRYGIALNGGVDCLALTNLDKFSGLPEIRLCRSYRYEGDVGLLEPYFLYERHGRDCAVIAGFKTPSRPLEEWGLADILARCRPCEYVTLPGWQEDITRTRKFTGLPGNARRLIEFLESPQGVATSVRIVSVHPSAAGKIELQPVTLSRAHRNG